MKKKTIWDLHRISPEEFKASEKLPLVMVLDNVRSLTNVGAILRTCDAFKVERVLLCGVTGCPPSPEIHKTALGAEDSVDWQYCKDTLEAVKELQAEGYTLCVLEQVEGSVSLDKMTVEPGRRYAIVRTRSRVWSNWLWMPPMCASKFPSLAQSTRSTYR